MGRMTDDWYRENTPVRDGELEVDAGAIVSNGADKGAYVQCWVWVPDPDEEIPGHAVIETPSSAETAGAMLDEHSIDDCDKDDALAVWADALRDALERDPRAERLEVSAARGERVVHHGWNGAAWSERWSGCATMDTLTESESEAVWDAVMAADAALADFAAQVDQPADA